MPRPKPSEPNVNFSVRLPAVHLAALRTHCADHDVIPAQAVRWSIRDYLARHEADNNLVPAPFPGSDGAVYPARLPESLYARMHAYCARNGLVLAQLVRWALAEYLDKLEAADATR